MENQKSGGEALRRYQITLSIRDNKEYQSIGRILDAEKTVRVISLQRIPRLHQVRVVLMGPGTRKEYIRLLQGCLEKVTIPEGDPHAVLEAEQSMRDLRMASVVLKEQNVPRVEKGQRGQVVSPTGTSEGKKPEQNPRQEVFDFGDAENDKTGKE